MQHSQWSQDIRQGRAIFIFILMAMFLCFEMALQVSPGVMTRQLTAALSLSPFALGLMSGLYYLTYTLMQIPSGLMFDRKSFRNVAVIAISVCAIGAGIFGLANSMLTGALARMFMGFGSAFAFLSVLTVADRYFPAKYFAFLTGIAQLLAALGGMAGEFPVAFSVHQFGWRETLYGLCAIGLVLAVLVRFLVPTPAPEKLCNGVCEPMWQTVKVIIKNKQTWFVGAYAFLNWSAMTAFAALWGVPFLEAAYHLPTETAAGLVALMWLGVGLASPFIGGLSDWLGRRNPLLIMTGLVGMLSIGLVLYVNLPVWVIGVLLFLTGLGCSGQILTFAVIKDDANSNRVSTSIGFINMAEVASGLLVQPMVGKLIEWHAADSSYSLADYHFALGLLPVAFALSAVLGWVFIRETYCGRKRAP